MTKGSNKKLLLTGSTGLLGSAIANQLEKYPNYQLICAVRSKSFILAPEHRSIKIDDLGANTDWAQALLDVGVVIHSAARAHVMNDSAADPLSEFRKVNVEGTLNLARQAVTANVKRFIFISTIKVNGESTVLGKPFKEDDRPAPEDSYAISKWEAEIGLQQLADETGMEVVIIRPTLAYGPGVKANFLRMMRWIDRGLPLPFGAISNKRSLVAFDNLADLIIACIEHPAAGNQTFLVGDGEDLSTTELMQRVGKAMGKHVRLIPFPAGLLILAASILGKRAVAQRLCGSLQVDISKARLLLGWEPPVSVDEGLHKVVEDFKNAQRIDSSG